MGIRIVVAAACAALVGLGSAPSVGAQGGSSLTVDATPNPTPAGRELAVAVSGYSATPVELYTVIAPARASCPAGASSSSSARTAIAPTAVQGQFSLDGDAAPLAPGSYTLCSWEQPPNSSAAQPALESAAQTIDSVAPLVGLSVAAPTVTTAGTPAAIALDWTSNGPVEAWLDLRPSSQGVCAARRSEEPADAVTLVDPAQDPDNSAFDTVGPAAPPGTGSTSGSEIVHPVEQRSGEYRVCGYLQELTTSGNQDPAATTALEPAATAVILVRRPGRPSRPRRHK